MNSTPVHRNATSFLRNASREIRGEPTGWRRHVAAAAAFLGLGRLLKKAALTGVEAGGPRHPLSIAPPPPPPPPSNIRMEYDRLSGPFIPKPGVSLFSEENTPRVVELFRLGDHRLEAPPEHPVLAGLAAALSAKQTVRDARPDLLNAVDALGESGLSVMDFRLALALVRLAHEPRAEARLLMMSNHPYQSEVSGNHYATAARFITADANFLVHGDRLKKLVEA